MAENQDRDSRARNEARNGGGHQTSRAKDLGPRLDFDEQASVGRRSLERVGQFYLEPAKDVPDNQPRD